MKIRKNIRYPCPECGSQKVHRIFTGNSVLFTIFITVMAGSSAYFTTLILETEI